MIYYSLKMMRNVLVGVIVSVVVLHCTPSKMTNMESKENSNFSCDIETGICTPGELAKQELSAKSLNVQPKKVKLIYYYDALCGWCYGFSPVMLKLNERYGERLDIEVISGGLFLGDRVGSVNKVAPHIKAGAYKSVEQRTGVKFGATFLADVFGEGKMTLNSLPPSTALCIVKEHLPEKELVFAEMLLHAVYFDGFDPIDIKGYGNYAEKIGFDRADFNAKMQENKYKTLALKAFEKFRTSQFSGMPALVLETTDQQILLSNGYTNFENLSAQLDQFFN